MSLETTKELESYDEEQLTNGGEPFIMSEAPYVANITIAGTTSLLFHRWNCEAVKEKADSKKGSKAKKTDDVESYVYRDAKNYICLPSEYLRMSIIGAAKYLQDPRSPRKSAQDLFKAGIIALDELCSLGSKDWDYIDKRRVTVQRAGITRMRPAFNTGWEATVRLQVLIPEYLSRETLNEAIVRAGKLVGVGDFRPTFGRFQITHFEIN